MFECVHACLGVFDLWLPSEFGKALHSSVPPIELSHLSHPRCHVTAITCIKTMTASHQVSSEHYRSQAPPHRRHTAYTAVLRLIAIALISRGCFTRGTACFHLAEYVCVKLTCDHQTLA